MILPNTIRYQVFVSSPFKGLEDEREVVFKNLMMMDCFPAGMELFPASDEKWEVIKQAIDLSDYYVVILAGRYGSEDEEGLGFTEKEYDYAASKGVPILGFLHGEPDKLPQAYSELSEQGRQKLGAFRSKIEKKMVRYWHNADQLGGLVLSSLNQAVRAFPRPGWIPANRSADPAKEVELLQLRARILQLETELARSQEDHQSNAAATLRDRNHTVTISFSGPKEKSDIKFEENLGVLFDIVASVLVGSNSISVINNEASDFLVAHHFHVISQKHGSSASRKPDTAWGFVPASDIRKLIAVFELLNLTRRQSVRDGMVEWHLTDQGAKLFAQRQLEPR
jgi:Domain of unknown function (DUF4062)